MSKKMTPCERLGYKVGDKFKASKSGAWFNVGEEVELGRDDGSNYPYFFNARMPKDSDGGWPRHIESVEKISNAKLKPAKQALADAIHQNGGWPVAGDCNFVTSNRSGVVKFFNHNPLRNGDDWVSCPYSLSWIDLHQQLPNWHQCILSRDEYFAAYPEQVKVEICNETKHKVEVEMESESEVTIKVSDWYKNGELPPVGETCLYVVSERLSVEVEITAHAKLGICFVQVGQSGESYVSKVAELHRFRPLRTERENAIDEMVDCLSSRLANCEAIAAHLYENGYRKEVK